MGGSDRKHLPILIDIVESLSMNERRTLIMCTMYV